MWYLCAMKIKNYEDWVRGIKPISQEFTILKTQEEKCEFCKKYIMPCITEILTRDWSKIELPPIEEYTWEVITPYDKK